MPNTVPKVEFRIKNFRFSKVKGLLISGLNFILNRYQDGDLENELF